MGIRTGSTAFPGAAVLGVEAAWRAGVGMVRYVGPSRAEDLVLRRRPETVPGAGRVQAWVIGSGTSAADRSDEETAALRGILAGAEPVVVDAGALDLAGYGAAPRLLTPHAREHDRVRAACALPPLRADADDEERRRAACETAAELGAAVLLKGAVTIVATPRGWVRRIGAATPWLATAGTGDVLAGVLGALVAGAGADDVEELGPLAATGVWLHSRAAARVAGRLGDEGGPLTAMDIAEALPYAVGELLAAGSGRPAD